MNSLSLEDASSSNHGPPHKNKLGYTRSSMACNNCRRRKIRCITSNKECERKCANCAKLKKECAYTNVDAAGNPGYQDSGPAKRSNALSITSQPHSDAVLDHCDEMNLPWVELSDLLSAAHVTGTVANGTSQSFNVYHGTHPNTQGVSYWPLAPVPQSPHASQASQEYSHDSQGVRHDHNDATYNSVNKAPPLPFAQENYAELTSAQAQDDALAASSFQSNIAGSPHYSIMPQSGLYANSHNQQWTADAPQINSSTLRCSRDSVQAPIGQNGHQWNANSSHSGTMSGRIANGIPRTSYAVAQSYQNLPYTNGYHGDI